MADNIFGNGYDNDNVQNNTSAPESDNVNELGADSQNNADQSSAQTNTENTTWTKDYTAQSGAFNANEAQAAETPAAPQAASFETPARPAQTPYNPDTFNGYTRGENGQYSMVHPAGGTTYFRAPSQPNAPGAQQTGYTQNPYPPQGGYGAPQSGYAPQGQNFGVNRGYAGYAAPQQEPKKKKDKKGMPAGAVAVVCAACIVLSGCAGFFGAKLAARGGAGGSDAAPDVAVLYRSVATDDGVVGSASVNDVVKAVADSVVEINTEFKSTGYFQYVTSGAGSGVIIDANGYIVTNNHVISENGKNADKVKVRLANGTEYDAKIIGTDSDTDIAVLKIEAKDLTVAVFADSDKLVVGQDIVAIGNPLGELGGTVTEGIISALDREVDVENVKMNLLQFSAAVNPGNSGGGLFNMKGELVGIVNAKSSGSGIEGLGFAIPANDASHIASELMTNGYVTGKIYIGLSLYYTSDPFTAYRYFGSQNPGLFIYDVVKGYNDSVLKQGDRLIAVNGNEVASSDDVKQILKKCSVGDKLKFSLYREGKLMEVEVTCYEYAPDKSDINFDN